MSCSITDPGGCVIEYLFGFIVDLINMALQPFLNLNYKLLSEPVNISIFADVWGVIIYVLSLFYGLLLIWIGFKFIISGESPEEREKAKTSLKNTLIMIVLVQTSYYIYELILLISSGLTKGVLNIAGNDFFNYTSESFSNLALEIIFLGLYIIHLIITSLILMIRYIAVSSGVIFFAIGIFFYFISPLHNYGKLIINGLMVLIFLPFFYSLIFLTASRLLLLNSLSDIKILIVIGSFDLVIISTFVLLLFVLIKAASKVMGPIAKTAIVAKTIGAI
ncbi:hypothetical protein J4429_00310 [Candidatus Pacearchaeota archaeon]|nr:hypothetical protein [Candidatus Pacearchaeota archaeon]